MMRSREILALASYLQNPSPHFFVFLFLTNIPQQLQLNKFLTSIIEVVISSKSMSKYTPDLQVWFDNTTPSKLLPDEKAYLPATEVKDLIQNHSKETALIDLRKNDFLVCLSPSIVSFLFKWMLIVAV